MDDEHGVSANMLRRRLEQTKRCFQLRKACLLSLFEKFVFYTQNYISLNTHDTLPTNAKRETLQ